MAWIEVHENVREHPKTYALAEALKIDQYAAGGLLMFLWTWALSNAQDGDLSKFPETAIARACFWTKKAGDLVRALCAAGWLDDDMHIHDWAEYAGRLITKRTANKERMKKARAGVVQRTCNAQNTHDNCKEHAQSANIIETCGARAGATVPNLTVPITPIVPLNGDADASPRPRDEIAELFDVFWSTYPRKTAKANALKSWRKIKPDKPLAQRIILAVREQAKTSQWTRDDGQYIPHPATWLNQRRWEDEIEPSPSAPENPYDKTLF